MRRGVALALVAALAGAVLRAHAAEPDEDDLAAGVRALGEDRPADAIARFEAIADRGAVDAAASFDRGLAYALRVKQGAPQPGDLGRAIHGFEEARGLTRDAARAEAAASAVVLLRSEVARRRAAAGDAPYVQPGPPALRLVVRALPEDAWSAFAAVGSLVLTAGLFLRWRATGRTRLAAIALAAGGAGALVVGAGAGWVARDDRRDLVEGVTIADNVRATDDAHAPVVAEAPIAEGTRLEIVGSREGWTRVRLPTQAAWIPSHAILPLARP